MTEKQFKVEIGDISLSILYFGGELGVGKKEHLDELFDKLNNIHRHADYEIFFIQSGELKIVSEEEILHFSDSAVILPPSFAHYTVTDAERVFVLYLNVNSATGKVGEELLKRLSSGIISLKLSDDEKFYLDRLAVAEREYDHDCTHIIFLLFSEIIRRIVPYSISNKKQTKNSQKHVFELDEYIERHYRERIRLSDVAEAMHFCEKQVSRIIKKEYGCSFSELVNMKRLSVAAMMLKHTALTVEEIAHSVGFENDNYFYRVFRKKYGSTPSEYRHNQKTSEQ